jgi:exonuclease VII small subunit
MEQIIPLCLIFKTNSTYSINVKMVMIMNVINLKTLSLSALMTSTMITGAFSMEPEPLDQNSQIQNVRSARSMFENGQSPVNQKKTIKKTNFMKDIEKANGPSIKDAGAMFDQGQSPIKQDKEIQKIDFMEDLEKADNTSGRNLLQTREQILSEAKAQTQILQKAIEDLKASIPMHEKVLEDLQSEIANVERNIANFKNGVWISRESAVAKIIITPVNYLCEKIWGSNKPSSESSAKMDNKEFSSNSTEETKEAAPDVSINKFSIIANDNGGKEIFNSILQETKEKADAQFMELKTQLETITTEISSAKITLESKKEEYERAIKGEAEIKSQALLTNDQLNGVASSVTSAVSIVTTKAISTTSTYNPLNYFRGVQEEKK